jgi:hypothetical protein
MCSRIYHLIFVLLAILLVASCQGDLPESAVQKNVSRPENDPNQAQAIDLHKSPGDSQSAGEASETSALSATLDLTFQPEDSEPLSGSLEPDNLEEAPVLPDMFNIPEKEATARFKSKLLTNDQAFDSDKPHKSIDMIDGAEVTIEKRL